MTERRVLHLHRVHLEAPDIDHIIPASAQVDKTVLIQISQVGAVDAAVPEGGGGRLRVVDIAAHYRAAGNDDVAVRVDFHAGVLHRAAYAAFHILAVVEVICRHAAYLRAAQGIVQAGVGQGFGKHLHIGVGNRGRTGFDEVNLVRKGAEPLVGELHQQAQARRHHKGRELGERKLEHLEEGVHILKAVQHADRAAYGQDRVHLEQGGDVVERTADDEEQLGAELKVADEVVGAGLQAGS